MTMYQLLTTININRVTAERGVEWDMINTLSYDLMLVTVCPEDVVKVEQIVHIN